MKSIRFLILYIQTFALRYKIQIFLVLVFFLLGMFFLTRMQSTEKRKVISEGVIGTYTEKDLPRVVTNLISEGLFELGETGLPKGKLVESFEVDEEVKTYKLKLKPNLEWNDGTKIEAADIKIPFTEAKVNIIDDKTLEVKLTEPFSPLPALLTDPILKRESLVGVGDYLVSSIDFFGKDRVFVRKVLLTPKDTRLPELMVRFYPNEKIAKNALKVGEVQSILGITESEDISNQKPFSLWSKPNYSKLVTIFYNTQDPILSDENFRLALSFASPSVSGEEEAKTSIPPHSWAFNKEVKDYLDNFSQAESYLKKVQKGKEETITLTTTTALKNIGEKIISSWSRIGIKAVLRVESGIPQNFQALLIASELPADSADQYFLWHSTQSQTNISKYSFVRIDKDLEDARKTNDLEVRKARYADFQRVLLDHAPATFLYFPKYNVVYLRKIEGDLKNVLELQLKNL